MTHVDVVYHAGQIQSIKVEGHAGQDEYGKDLACAGISTAVVGIYNMLEAKGFMKDGNLANVESGYSYFEIFNNREDYQIILETLLKILKLTLGRYNTMLKLDLQLFASKKGVGSTKNGRDSESKRLGAKLSDGQTCTAGSIIYRQRGTKVHPGTNVGKGGDDTLFAKVDGVVKYERLGKNKKQVSVYPVA